MTHVYDVALLPCGSPVVHKLPILGAVIILLNEGVMLTVVACVSL